jgi:hypothetical protein
MPPAPSLTVTETPSASLIQSPTLAGVETYIIPHETFYSIVAVIMVGVAATTVIILRKQKK